MGVTIKYHSSPMVTSATSGYGFDLFDVDTMEKIGRMRLKSWKPKAAIDPQVKEWFWSSMKIRH